MVATNRLTVLLCILTVLVLVFINNWSYSLAFTAFEEAMTAANVPFRRGQAHGANFMADFEAAIPLAQQAVALASTDSEISLAKRTLGLAQFNIAQSSPEPRDFSASRATFQEITLLANPEPDCLGVAFNYIAIGYSEPGDLPNALLWHQKAYESAKTTRETRISARHRAAMILEMQARLSDAVIVLLDGFAEGPGTNIDYTSLFVRLRPSQTQLAEAVLHLKTPTEWHDYYTLGALQSAIGKRKEALAACEQAYTLIPEGNKEARERVIALGFDIVWRERLRKGSLEVQ